jgi:hypothetical protein
VTDTEMIGGQEQTGVNLLANRSAASQPSKTGSDMTSELSEEHRVMLQAFGYCVAHGKAMSPAEIAAKPLAAQPPLAEQPPEGAPSDWGQYLDRIESEARAVPLGEPAKLAPSEVLELTALARRATSGSAALTGKSDAAKVAETRIGSSFAGGKESGNLEGNGKLVKAPSKNAIPAPDFQWSLTTRGEGINESVDFQAALVDLLVCVKNGGNISAQSEKIQALTDIIDARITGAAVEPGGHDEREAFMRTCEALGIEATACSHIEAARLMAELESHRTTADKDTLGEGDALPAACLAEIRGAQADLNKFKDPAWLAEQARINAATAAPAASALSTAMREQRQREFETAQAAGRAHYEKWVVANGRAPWDELTANERAGWTSEAHMAACDLATPTNDGSTEIGNM